MWRNFKFRLAVWILAGILALLVVLLVTIHTPPVRRFALKQAIEILGKQGVTFDAASVDYNLLAASATLNDVTVRSRQAPDLPPLAHADRVSVDMNLRKLISGAIHIENGEIRNPSLHLVIDEKGRDNIPRPPKSESKSKVDYFIDWFVASGGSVRVEDRRQQIDATLPLGRLTVDGNPATNNHEIRLETHDPGRLSFQQRSLPIRGVGAELLLEKNAVDVRSLKLGLGDSTIAFSGKLNNFDDPRYDFNGDTNLALGSLVEFAGVKQKVAGNVHVALTATGPIAQFKATARIDGQNLTIEKFDRLNLKAETAYDASAQRVYLESFNIFSPAGTIQGKGNLALNTKVGDSTLNASVRGLDLAKISSVMELPVHIASRGTADISARWPALAFEQASGDAIVRLAATRSTPAKNVVPVSGVINAKTIGNRIVVGIPSLQTLDAHATGQITLVNRSTLGGEIRVEAPDVAATVADAEAFLGNKPGALVGTNVGGSLNLDAKLGGTVQNPAASATLSSPGLQVGTLAGVAVNAAIDYTPALLNIQSATIDWQNQQLSASGAVGLKGRAPAIDLHAQTSNVSIPAVLAALGRSEVPASGNVSLEATVKGTTKNPQADINLSATDLQAYNETIGKLTAQAQLADQVVTVNQLRVDKPQTGGDGSLQANAKYNLESKDYTVAAESKNLRLTSLTLPDGTPVRADINLQAQGAGNVDNPALNLKLAANNIQYADQQYGSANLTADVANQQANIQAEAPKFNLSAKANIGTKEPNPATFEVTANNTDIASLPVKLDQPIAGIISATVRGSGDLKQYEQGQASVEVSKLDLTWNKQPIRTEGPLIARYRNRMLTIERATVAARDSRISIDGKLPLDASAGAGAINVASTLNLETLLAYVPTTEPITARGTASINGTITGTLKSIDPRLSISLDNGYVSTASLDPPLANLTLRAEVRDGALELRKASTDWGIASFTASGEVPFALLPANLPVELPRRQGPAQLTAELKGLDLATIQGVPENLGGNVAFRLEAQAPKPELEAVTAKLTFPVLRVNLGSYELEQKGTSTVTVQNAIARVDQFQLTGPETDIRLSGTAGLTGSRPLDVKLDGKLDAAIAGAFTEAVRARGATEIRVAVTGTAQQPQAAGFVQLSNAQISLQNPRVGIDGLNARLELAGNRVNLTRLEGSLNGGTLSGGGGLEYANGGLRNTNLNIKADRVYLDYPQGLKTVSNIVLNFRNAAGNLILGGNVVIEDGGFTDDLNLDTGVLAALSAPRGVELTEQRNRLVESIRFDLGIRTDNPLIIDNNLAKAEITADLRLLGNPYQPGLSGRLTIEEGGEITLNERRYLVERGVVTFTNERRIEPGLDILARTTAGGFDITLQVSGVPGKTETTLTSDPPLPEPDILAVLLTGKTLDDIRGQEYEVARNQVLSYLTGRVGSSIGRGIAGATGLSTVRIEPNLIANETNPSARLTVGQDITNNFNLIYSMDLINSSDQIYVAEYDLTKRFVTRGVRQSDGSFRFDFRHDVRFGGIPEPRRGERRQKLIVDNVTILGNTYFSDMKIADKLGVKRGKQYDFFKVRKGVDRVNKMYAKENLLEATVRLNRQVDAGRVDLTVQVERGPAVDFVFEGIGADKDLRNRIREIWQSGVFDRQRADDAVAAIQQSLVKDDYLQPKIEYTITTPTAERKRVLFDIQPGPKFQDVQIAFEGASGIKPGTLRDIIKEQKLSTEVYVKPGRVTELLSRFYQEQGYLEAKIDNPRYELDAQTRTGKVVFPVQEGPLFRIAAVDFEGNTVYDDAKLASSVPLPKGEAYRPVLRERSLQKVQELYWDQGYNDVEAEITTRRNKEAATVDVIVTIAENRQGVIREIIIEGNRNTSDGLIRTQLEANSGDVLNLQKLSNSRRNLYNTGAYSLVDIVREEIAPAGQQAAAAEQVRSREAAGAKPEKPIRLTVKVREVQPFQIRYGASFDTERGPGVIADFENRNSLGSARSLGLRTRYDSQLQEARLYFSQPLLRRFPVKTIASPYLRRERNPATSDADPFNVDRVGFTLQQEARLFTNFLFNYGYRIERSRTYDAGPNPVFDIPLRIAALTNSLTRDMRDEVLDATRGDFMSHAFEFSPKVLGSELQFVKYFGQYFRYHALQKPKVELFTNKVLRPRFVYAGGVRVGLATGIGGQELPLSERFFAGGATTIRGFEQNSVGEVGAGRTPLGGDAMLVINNELRFPVISIFDGVGFVDVGNVYRRVSDFSVTDIRKAAGMGIRVRTPWVLIRLDYGFKLDRRAGEPIGRLFFSIGQAF